MFYYIYYIPLNTKTGIDGVNTEDLGFAILQYENGISVIRMGGAEVGGFERRQLVICGSKGTLEIKPLEIGIPSIECGREYMMYSKQKEYFCDGNYNVKAIESVSEPFQRYEKMLLSFAEMVRGEKENPYTLDYELMLFKTLLKCCGVNADK